MTRAHFFNPLPSRQDAVKLIAEYMFVCLLFVLYRFFAKGLSACHDKNVLCINTYHRNNTLCKHTKQLSDPIPLAPHLPKQLNVSIAVKIFYLFKRYADASKRKHICGPHLFNKVLF